MDFKAALDAHISRWDLQQHPFYIAWSAGTLPLEALKTYAGDYGAFIGSIDKGWERVGNDEHAAEERVHAGLWEQFARALGTVSGKPQTPEVAALLELSRRLFNSKPSALGALYAFEAQQPLTSEAKLKGLRSHYPLPESAHTYFMVHASDYHEADMIVEDVAMLGYADREVAVAACGEMCEALYNALSGIYNENCAMA
jgi:pyrroloquinoline-quinone synthase